MINANREVCDICGILLMSRPDVRLTLSMLMLVLRHVVAANAALQGYLPVMPEA